FAPARRDYVCIDLCVQIDHRGIRSPRPAENYRPTTARRGREPAVVENVRAGFFRVVLALRREHYVGSVVALELAMLEHGDAIAEYEVDVSFDEAIGKILSRWT